MSELTSWQKGFLLARRSDDPAVLLVTVSHESLGVFRMVRDTADLVSRGETFKSAWAEVGWVNDDGNLPQCSISVPNVDAKEVGQRYLRAATSPEVTLEVVPISQPDEPLARVARLDLKRLKVDEFTVSGLLTGKDHSAEPLGTVVVLPANFPALFRRQRKA